MSEASEGSPAVFYDLMKVKLKRGKKNAVQGLRGTPGIQEPVHAHL